MSFKTSIKFNQEEWLKPYSDMNTNLKTRKNDLGKDFFKLMNNAVFWKNKYQQIKEEIS